MSDVRSFIEQLRNHGWRQGSVLPLEVIAAARDRHSNTRFNEVSDDDWLIVISHDCDVGNRSETNEPRVEVLRAQLSRAKKPDSREVHGKNARRLHFEGQNGDTASVRLVASVHDRFEIGRELLAIAAPDSQRFLTSRTTGIIARWIAKRYVRQAFPDSFDHLAKDSKMKVDAFLETKHEDVVAVFLALADKSGDTPRFHAEFRLIAKTQPPGESWEAQKVDLESKFTGCWESAPGIELDVLAVRANAFSLADISDGGFKKFDRDWISYSYDEDEAPDPTSS